MAFDPARVKSLFLAASDLPSPQERATYLDRECGGEPDLRARVEALLAVEERAGPVPEPEANGVFRLAPAEALGATQMDASKTHSGSRISDAVAGPATVEATGFGGEQVTLDGAPSTARSGEFVPGRVIGGRYTLLEVLGEGGMGTVYRAEQSQPIKRQVALKLIKVGLDSRTVLARFDAERQALALMDHPNIARVYDGGATEANQPFFVMEFVDGVAITDYCDRYRLSVDARLQLFVAVCQAVQHAHQKGIIHRDLKPSNVMVTEVDGRPTPKVIDFGVAKATQFNLTDQSLGDTGAIVGTPSYMSPEQADPSTLDIDTRTDVYALGVILYELLAGSTPLDAIQFKRGALLEMLRMVREVDPSKPSTKVSTAEALPTIAANRGIDPERLKRELRGDLDWIVMKALEKDRTRRYETANGFAADILRHLASEPVLAAPPSRVYRLRKFVRKHHAGVIAASLLLLALLAGVTGTTLGLFEARRQEGLARDEADKAKAIIQFLTTDLLTQAEPANNAAEDHVSLLEVLDRAADKVGERFNSQPAVEVALRWSIADTYHGLASWDKAERQRRALVELARRPGARPGEYYQAESELAHNLRHQGRLDEETLAMARSATEGLNRTLGPDHPTTLSSMTNLASSYSQLGRHDEALKLHAETLALYKTRLGPDHSDTLVSMSNLAISYSRLGRNSEAQKLHEEVLALQKAKLGPDHPNTLNSMTNLASSYSQLGRHDEALKLNAETLALQKARLGPDHPDTLGSMNNLAISYSERGRLADAVKLREETLALRKAKLGPDHPDTLRSMNDLANSYDNLGRLIDALKLREETLALRKAKLGADHPDTLQSMNNLSNSYATLGRYADAVKLYEETLALRKAKLGADHSDTLASMNNLANVYSELGRPSDALKLREDVLALRKAKLGPDHPDTLASMNSLAASYSKLNRLTDAVKLSEEALAVQKVKLGPDHPATLHSMLVLANSENSLGRLTDALKLREETLALMKAKLGPDHPRTLSIMMNLAVSNVDLGRYAVAVKLYEEVLALQKAKLGRDHPDTLLSMMNLATSYFKFGRLTDALKLREETLALQNARLGPDHLYTFVSKSALAESYRDVGRYADAVKLDEEALALHKTKLGPDHPHTLNCRIALAESYRASCRQADALKLSEETLALMKVKLGPDDPITLDGFKSLAINYLAAGRVPEGISLLEEAAGRKSSESFCLLAAFQAWLGQDEAYAATRRRFLAFAKGTDNTETARQAAQAGALRPSADEAELEAVLVLGRKAVELDKGQWKLLALGMAEFRNGHFAAADEPLLSAAKAGEDVKAAGIAAFYRAMSLFLQGKKDEAGDIAIKAALQMKPLPKDEQNPLFDNATSDQLVLWLAYREAKALIGFDPPPAPTAPAAK